MVEAPYQGIGLDVTVRRRSLAEEALGARRLRCTGSRDGEARRDGGCEAQVHFLKEPVGSIPWQLRHSSAAMARRTSPKLR